MEAIDEVFVVMVFMDVMDVMDGSDFALLSDEWWSWVGV